MGLFDLFSNDTAERARDLANTGLTKGYGQLSDFYGQGRNAITTNYGKAADTYDRIYGGAKGEIDNLYKGGAEAYGDVSGAHGVEGLQRGTDLFKNSGYYGVFGAANDAALQALMRTHAAAGNPLSGNADVDAMKKSSELAGNYWGQFQQGLAPYLQNYGSAIGSNAAGWANGLANVFTNQGNALNTSLTGQGNAANTTETTIGKNDAAAELNNYQVARNQFDAIKSAASAAASFGTGGLTGGLSSLFSGFGGGGAGAANSGAPGGGYYGAGGQLAQGPGYYPTA